MWLGIACSLWLYYITQWVICQYKNHSMSDIIFRQPDLGFEAFLPIYIATQKPSSPISAKEISLQIKLQIKNLRIYEITKLHRNYIFVMPVFPLSISSIKVCYKITPLIKDSNNREFRQYIYPSKSSNAHIRAFIRAHPRARVRARDVFRGF